MSLDGRCAALGRELVVEHGVLPRHIMWDADETLWDWTMYAPAIVARLPLLLARRSFAHREWVKARPGIVALLRGMVEAAIERGEDDPWLRVWTNGYPWRVRAIAERIPGLTALLGPAPGDAFAAHPRIFCRSDYARAAAHLVDPDRRRQALAAFPTLARRTLTTQLESRRPLDSNFKLPELASLPDLDTGAPIKSGFSDVAWLVDDQGRNIKRFTASGRRGVRVVSHAPAAVGGRVPNTTWRRATHALQARASCIAEAIGHALITLASEAPPASRNAASIRRPDPASDTPVFAIDVPDDVLRAQWIEPMRALGDRTAAFRW